jgi:hypothetical protein
MSNSFLELKRFFLSSSISQNPANTEVVEKSEEMIFNLKINFQSFFYLKTSKYLKKLFMASNNPKIGKK